MNDTGKSAKLAKYDRLYEQIKGYIHTTEDIWARLATMEAVLHHKMQTFFWTGVYALIDDELIVRSYQGPVACQKLRHHTGVCWAAVSSEKTVIAGMLKTFPVILLAIPCLKVKLSSLFVIPKERFLLVWT